MKTESTLLKKKNNLIKQLRRLDSLVVAFSGGVDSTYLLAAAQDAGITKLAAVTIASPLHSAFEKNNAKQLARMLAVEHTVLDLPAPLPDDLMANTPERCYLCKRHLFEHIQAWGNDHGYKQLAHGANMDDMGDYRPGMRAARELDVLAPLLDARLRKDEIRRLAHERRLPNWQQPAMACLASRIPYQTPLTLDLLTRVEQAEDFLRRLGFSKCRVRCHAEIARIELAPEDIVKAVDDQRRLQILAHLQTLGFRYVAIDLAGYVQGSLNP
jgi:uncharacterized protein